MASNSPGFHKERVWFRPTESDQDGIFFEIRDVRQRKHADRSWPLEEHPRADCEPELEDYRFVYREPHDSKGDFVKDWYAPLSLVDDLLAVSRVGNSYESRLLYTRGQTPPSEDERVDVLGDLIEEDILWNATWADDPVTAAPGIDVMRMTLAAGELLGSEVYLVVSGQAEGVYPPNGRYTILRHVSNTAVHIEVAYDPDPAMGINITGSLYEACYLLDGFSDSKDAPGILQGKFNVRSFVYRLAEASFSSPWDDSLGLKIVSSTRFVPRSWAKNLDGTTASTSDEESHISYNVVSKQIAQQTKQEVDDAAPAEDGSEWGGRMRLQVPAILKEAIIPYATAYATKGDYLAADEAWALSTDAWGPGTLGAVTRTRRRIVKKADVSATITAELAGQTLFSFRPATLSLNLGTSLAYTSNDGNVFARARMSPYSIGPFLLKESPFSITIPPGITGVTGGGTETKSGTETPNTVIFWVDNNAVPPWGTEVVWNVDAQKARWGYWIIDITFVTLPANPAL